MIILKNDEFFKREEVLIDIEERGFQFGDGVYEVVRIYNGEFFLLDDHLKRLQYSLNEIKINYNVQEKNLKQLIISLAQKNNVQDGGIYLQITRGTAIRAHAFPESVEPTLIAYPIKVATLNDLQQSGAKATLVKDIRWLRCDIKSLNLLGNVLAKQKAKEKSAYEAIQYRSDEHVTEGSSSNVFIVKDGTLFTHPSNHYILNGITRRYTHYLAEKLSIPYKEESFSVQSLLDADEVFVTSTTSEIMPIIEVDGKKINNGKPGPLTTKLLKAFFEHLNLEKLPNHL